MQNAEGGWGEGLGSYQDPARAGRGLSTPSQSAWALMGLMTQLSPDDDAVKKGVTHLVHSQTSSSVRERRGRKASTRGRDSQDTFTCIIHSIDTTSP